MYWRQRWLHGMFLWKYHAVYSRSAGLEGISAARFFQAEDGIGDAMVTGVQTCALPISSPPLRSSSASCRVSPPGSAGSPKIGRASGEEWRSPGSAYSLKKKRNDVA